MIGGCTYLNTVQPEKEANSKQTINKQQKSMLLIVAIPMKGTACTCTATQAYLTDKVNCSRALEEAVCLCLREILESIRCRATKGLSSKLHFHLLLAPVDMP